MSNPSTQSVLPGTEQLNVEGDLAAAMVAGIDRYLDARRPDPHERPETPEGDDFGRSAPASASRTCWALSIPAIAERSGSVSPIDGPTEVASGQGYRIFEVSWPALKGVDGEGLLLQPDAAAGCQRYRPAGL